jgi:hypothetical protein
MLIDGDVHQSSTIKNTMIRGVHNMKYYDHNFGNFTDIKATSKEMLSFQEQEVC